ncbi:Major Facilitator Superfamily protein [Halopelagius inordinatus]|uniref:Major Facilitator Superfamily protein n=1 Tax=Halopelagius inordinatus TaxID=553467 RepID=A0A1I2NX26_9EURY|nr:MFS transporter [Halopelagius inordinatus]SFG08228.1 Major Facilitator Superfamily protein [Halopelagius inordinatus]
MDGRRSERVRLALAVWAVLVSQVLVYPGVSDLVVALGGSGDVNAGMWFLVAEFAAFVVFAGVWGAASDALGRRKPLVVLGALGGAGGYLLLVAASALGLPFSAILLIRALGGAMTIGAFSLSMTALADLSGGNGRNMGAAGIAIGLGAALGSVVGGLLADVDPFYPLYGATFLLFATAVVVATAPDRTPDGVRIRLGPALSRLSEKPVLAVPYAFGFIDRMTAGFFALVGVYYFRETFGLDAFGAGLALAAFFLPFALLQYPSGILSDRIGRFTPVVVGSVCFGLSIVAVGLAPTLGLAVAAMVVVGGFGALVAPATMALVTDVAAPEERGAALGGFNVFGSLGFLAGFVVGGVATSTAGYLAAFLAVGLSEVAIALVAARAVSRLAPSRTGGQSLSADD